MSATCPRGEQLCTRITQHRHRPPPCPSRSSPSLWSLPAPQAPLLCPWPRTRLQRLRCHQPPRCLTPPNRHPSGRSPLWPPTPSSWSQTSLLTRSWSPRPPARACRSLLSSRRPSATRGPSSPPISRRCSPRQALRSSRLPCRTLPSAGGVLLMTAATQTSKNGPEGKNLKKKKKNLIILEYINLSLSSFSWKWILIFFFYVLEYLEFKINEIFVNLQTVWCSTCFVNYELSFD